MKAVSVNHSSNRGERPVELTFRHGHGAVAGDGGDLIRCPQPLQCDAARNVFFLISSHMRCGIVGIEPNGFIISQDGFVILT